MNNQPSLFKSHHNPYYIHAPNYRQSSAGIRALHYLCHFLNECGYEAYITPNVTRAGLRTPRINGQILREHFLCGKNPIFIYPEIYNGNPLNGATIARWLLNKPGHLGGDRFFSKSELIFYYANWTLHEDIDGKHLYIPTLDRSIFNNENNKLEKHRQGFCYYANKFLLFGGKIPKDIQQHGISLGQENKLSAQEIANYLRRSEFLYCFEQSAIIEEARACGCPVLIFPSDYSPEKDWLTPPPGVALAKNINDIRKLKKELGNISHEEREIFEFTIKLIHNFINDTQDHSKTKIGSAIALEVANNPSLLWQLPVTDREKNLDAFVRLYAPTYPDVATDISHIRIDPTKKQIVSTPIDLSAWLLLRQPAFWQSKLIEKKFESEKNRPLFQIFIIQDKTSNQKSNITLESLDQQPYRNYTTKIIDSAANLSLLAPTFKSTPENSWLIFIQAGSTFIPAGLQMAALEISQSPELRALYADELVRLDIDRMGHMLRPAFNIDMLLSFPAGMSRHWFFRLDVFLGANELNAAYGESTSFQIILHLIEKEGLAGLGHVQEPLLVAEPPVLQAQGQETQLLENHLHARGYENATIDCTLPGRYRIHYGHPTQPSVSIIIPTKDQFPLLERCVTSLLEKTTYPHFEILLVDNASTDPAACAWLDGLAGMGDARIRVLRYPGPFNFADINNFAVREAQGEYLVLLNNDTAIIHGDWLDALLNHAQRPEVGMVGAKLLTPQGTIEHAGYLLGVQGAVASAFAGLNASEPGYMHRLEIDQNYSAVSAACMMVRRSLYEELGGMDAQEFPHLWADVDLCLRARGAGYLTVWTPHATLLHEGGASRANLSAEENTQQTEKAQEALYRHWLPVLARDPASNRNVSLQSTSFEVETDASLNWNPLIWRPVPTVLAVHADAHGCGHYRIIHPGHGMTQAGIADVRVRGDHIPLIEMERLQPDSWILQRQITDAQYEFIQRTSKLSRAFKVGELDDFLPNLPLKSVHRAHMPKDIWRAMRRWLGAMDRFVVSTEPLAEALAGLHRDTRVVHNRLPPERWRGLKSLRQQGRRPRVGWAGGTGHQGDLEVIADVVKALAGEVDWVFFGMCPQSMRPYLHEFHGPTSFEKYPQKLADLDLDLALAPLESHIFNDCKSNLRLLEYGACGFPVVCSDALPYRCDLPVTRVKNRYKDWVDAIRMHTNDLNATAAAGDALRAAVLKDWMLEGEHLEHWLKAWLPD